MITCLGRGRSSGTRATLPAWARFFMFGRGGWQQAARLRQGAFQSQRFCGWRKKTTTRPTQPREVSHVQHAATFFVACPVVVLGVKPLALVEGTEHDGQRRHVEDGNRWTFFGLGADSSMVFVHFFGRPEVYELRQHQPCRGTGIAELQRLEVSRGGCGVPDKLQYTVWRRPSQRRASPMRLHAMVFMYR